jgi:hypothetical protein
LREQDARLGGIRKIEESLPLTNAGNSARRRMFPDCLVLRVVRLTTV